MPLANLTEAARLGFQSGQEQGKTNVNPLGQFVRGMLSMQQQRQGLEAEYGMKKGLAETEMASKFGFEKYKAQLEEESPQGKYYNEMANAIKTNPFLASQETDTATDGSVNPLAKYMTDPNLTEQDYINKPTKVSVRGMPQIVSIPNPKDPLSADQEEAVRSITTTINYLDRLEELSPKVDTGYVAGRKFEPTFPFNRLLMGINPKSEDIEFKSTLTQAKASHAKAESGVQRGFKEIEFLKGAMPESTYDEKGFMSSVSEAKFRNKLNLRNTLMAADRQGKRLGKEYREMMSSLIEEYPLDKYPFAIKSIKDNKTTEQKVDYKSKYGLD